MSTRNYCKYLIKNNTNDTENQKLLIISACPILAPAEYNIAKVIHQEICENITFSIEASTYYRYKPKLLLNVRHKIYWERKADRSNIVHQEEES